MSTLDFNTLGAPGKPRPRSRVRAVAALVAAFAGAVGLTALAFIVIGSVSPGEAPAAFVVAGVLLVIWLTGMWWRWDAPDRREKFAERERRGF